MKKTKVDKLGRIVIPVSYRKSLRISPETELIVNLQENGILITPLKSICKICEKPLENATALPVCNVCISRIKSLNI